MAIKKSDTSNGTEDLESKIDFLEKKLEELSKKLEKHEAESKAAHSDLEKKCDASKQASSGSEDKECREAVKAICRSLLNPRATIPDVSGL